MTHEPVPPPPPQYAAPPQVAYNYYPASSTSTNVLAVVSMIASILGVVAMPIVASIAGVVMGHIANKQIAQTGEQGAGMAKAGLIVGYAGLALWVLFVVGYFVFFFLLFAAASMSAY